MSGSLIYYYNLEQFAVMLVPRCFWAAKDDDHGQPGDRESADDHIRWVRCKGPLAVVLRRPDPPMLSGVGEGLVLIDWNGSGMMRFRPARGLMPAGRETDNHWGTSPGGRAESAGPNRPSVLQSETRLDVTRCPQGRQ